MFKLEFDITNPALTLAFAKALREIGDTLPARTIVEHHVTSAEINEFNDASIAAERALADTVQNSVKEAGQGDGADIDYSGQALKNSADAGANTSQKLDYDTKGVPFIPAICAKAAKPFYASGPYVGQWKKGTKVDQAEYDRVYGEALAKVLGAQTSVGQQIQNSPAADVFGGQQDNAIDQTIKENPVTANDVFALYGELCANNGAVAANGICAAAGIENGTLIFSRPDLVDDLYESLTTLKRALASQGA